MNTLSSSAPIYRELSDALRQRLAVIGDRAAYERDAAAHLRQLQAASEKIVDIQQRLPSTINPQFRHYLERCSYDKALSFLEETTVTV